MIHILLVEDDPALSRGIQVSLEIEKYRVSIAESLKEAFVLNAKESINLVILDLGLPDGSGFDFLRKIRKDSSKMPVVILTAQTAEDTVVEGLQLGANDYIRKPFGTKELLARIKTVLREPQLVEDKLRLGEIVFILDQRKVFFGSSELEMNRREYDILLFLAKRVEKIVNRADILKVFEGEDGVFDRTLDSHISHIRSRLKKSGVQSIKIQSVYGVGYRLEKI